MSEDTPGVLAAKRTAWEAIKRMRVHWPARTWTQELVTEYGRLITRAGREDIEAIHAGCQQAIEETEGNFPPTPADVARRVRAYRLNNERAAEAEQAQRKRAESHHPDRPWFAWLAFGAHYAGAADRREVVRMVPGCERYRDIAELLDYRNHHGCADDPEYDPDLWRRAVSDAEQAWREQGSPAAPNPAALMGASL